MKAIVYRRVSKEDSKTKDGLGRQKVTLDKFLAFRDDIVIVEDITVDGVSGARPLENQKLHANIQGAMAGYFREYIRDNLAAGRERAAQKGIKPAGENPFGYTFDRDQKMYVFTDDIPQVKEMIKMFKNGLSRRKNR